MDSDLIFIPHNTPSLKNSKIKTSRGVFPSKTVKNYLRALGIQKYSAHKKEVKGYKNRPNLFKKIMDEAGVKKSEDLVEIGFHFVRNSKRKFDFVNAMQLPLDMMVAHDYLIDDDCDHVIPYVLWMNDKPYSIDKSNAGVYLKITQKT